MFEDLRDHLPDIVLVVAIALFCGSIYYASTSTKQPEVLKEYKDGVQNHLIWDIKGKCYFVRPHSDLTVYLISVPDCDKK
jgi:hypothetical protein